MLPTFDAEVLRSRLAGLTPPQQATFGLSICERLLPSYELFVAENGFGDIATLKSGHRLIRLASGAETQSPEAQSPDVIERHRSACLAVTPDSDDFGSVVASLGQDAALVVVHCLNHLLDGDVAHLINAAQQAVDSADLATMLWRNENASAADIEQRILRHPLMQAELEAQERELVDLSAGPPPKREATSKSQQPKKRMAQSAKKPRPTSADVPRKRTVAQTAAAIIRRCLEPQLAEHGFDIHETFRSEHSFTRSYLHPSSCYVYVVVSAEPRESYLEVWPNLDIYLGDSGLGDLVLRERSQVSLKWLRRLDDSEVSTDPYPLALSVEEVDLDEPLDDFDRLAAGFLAGDLTAYRLANQNWQVVRAERIAAREGGKEAI